MAKKQKAEAERAREEKLSRSGARKSRAPFLDVSQRSSASVPGVTPGRSQSGMSMDLTLQASTTPGRTRADRSTGRSQQRSPLRGSSPPPGRGGGDRIPSALERSTSKRAASGAKSPKKQRANSSFVPEESPEKEPPLTSKTHRSPGTPLASAKTTEAFPKTKSAPGVSPKALRSKSKTAPESTARSKTKKSALKPKSPTRRKTPLSAKPEAPLFPPSDDEEPPEDVPEAEEEAGEDDPMPSPSPRQTSQLSPTKSSRKTSAATSRTAPKLSTKSPKRQPPAAVETVTETRTQSKRAASRRKNVPTKTVAVSKSLSKEMQRLQKDPGFLIARLSFMRVVRSISAEVSAENSAYRFTVEAMEALQTATEYYMTNVFVDAAKLANHAKRVTILPKDLDLLKTFKIINQ
ncbi:proteoglycan 4 [Galendromus occidentalis]|uniref:Proteoglycan 4 n=1 Tax=Galendromus occidentalis TaxID=34638 RepID=A0AAJ7PAL6_9ACAR|nr:proteoglycan 4 [Galendromus occidentalis]